MFNTKTFVVFLAGVSLSLAAPPTEECTATKYGVFVADTEICSRFYQCSPVGWAEFNCGDGTLYNPEHKVCDWPHNVNCTAKCTNGTRETLDDNQCMLFKYCDEGVWIDYRCPEGYRFDPTRKDCYTPQEYPCPTLACDSFPCQNGGICTNSNPTFVCTCPSTHTGAMCETEDTECTNGTRETLDDNQCMLFKYCDEGVWIDYRCPEGYRFDPTRKDCYTPQEYPCPTLACDSFPCQNGGICTNSNPTFVCTCPSTHTGAMCEDTGPCSTTSYQADPTSCNRFYACVGGQWSWHTCPYEVPVFNNATGVCDYLYNVDCGSRPLSCVNDARLRGSDTECMQFYKCIANEWVQYSCSAPLRFNNTIKDCATNVDCPTAQAMPCSSNPCQNNGVCTDVSATEYRCDCPPYTVGANCELECQYPCPQSVTVIFPDVANKSVAVICSRGELTKRACSPGEEFAPSVNRCAAVAPAN